MLKAAVIGVGAMGRHHARVYDQMTETQLVGHLPCLYPFWIIGVRGRIRRT